MDKDVWIGVKCLYCKEIVPVIYNYPMIFCRCKSVGVDAETKEWIRISGEPDDYKTVSGNMEDLKRLIEEYGGIK